MLPNLKSMTDFSPKVYMHQIEVEAKVNQVKWVQRLDIEHPISMQDFKSYDMLVQKC